MPQIDREKLSSRQRNYQTTKKTAKSKQLIARNKRRRLTWFESAIVLAAITGSALQRRRIVLIIQRTTKSRRRRHWCRCSRLHRRAGGRRLRRCRWHTLANVRIVLTRRTSVFRSCHHAYAHICVAIRTIRLRAVDDSQQQKCCQKNHRFTSTRIANEKRLICDRY